MMPEIIAVDGDGCFSKTGDGNLDWKFCYAPVFGLPLYVWWLDDCEFWDLPMREA